MTTHITTILGSEILPPAEDLPGEKIFTVRLTKEVAEKLGTALLFAVKAERGSTVRVAHEATGSGYTGLAFYVQD